MSSKSTLPGKACGIVCLLLYALVFSGSRDSAHGRASVHTPAAPAASASLTVTVVVTDAAGQPVGGLTQPDFLVTDNGDSTPILGFAAEPGSAGRQAPVQVVFVLDEINMAFTDVARAREQLSEFLRRGDGILAVPSSILILDDKGVSSSGAPSLDGKAIAADFDRTAQSLRTIRRSAAFYGDLERLTLSLRALESMTHYEATQPGHKLVVWLSPGWPYLAGPGTNYSAKEQQANFDTVVDLSASLRNAGITLYSVDPRGTAGALGFQATYYEGYLKGVRKASDTTLSNLGLQVLAYQSGGLVLNSSNAIDKEIAQCLADARSYYEFTVRAAGAEQHAQYHALEVHFTRPGLKARSATGYYAAP